MKVVVGYGRGRVIESPVRKEMATISGPCETVIQMGVGGWARKPRKVSICRRCPVAT